jgi:hypothetical protein
MKNFDKSIRTKKVVPSYVCTTFVFMNTCRGRHDMVLQKVVVIVVTISFFK